MRASPLFYDLNEIARLKNTINELRKTPNNTDKMARQNIRLGKDKKWIKLRIKETKKEVLTINVSLDFINLISGRARHFELARTSSMSRMRYNQLRLYSPKKVLAIIRRELVFDKPVCVFILSLCSK